MAEDNEPQAINKPWIIVYEPEELEGKLQTILAGKPDATYEQFGLVIADVIRHVARHFDVDEADVRSWVERELDNPTTEISGGRVN